jgi:hypothetical protein
MRIILATLCGGFLFSSTSFAEEYPLIIYGAGTSSCGKWLEERRSGQDHGSIMWLLGYLTAIGDQTRFRLKATDVHAVKAWTDQYCAEKPLSSVLDAARELSAHLRVINTLQDAINPWAILPEAR